MTFTDDDWLTPPYILSALGQFDLDPCAPAVRPWEMAHHHFTKDDNGLAQAWAGRVWCNPPYSKINGKSQIGLWLSKMVSNASGISLVNVRSETQWFFDYIWKASHAVFFFEGRIKFYRPDGTIGTTGTNASVLAAYSDFDARAIYGGRDKLHGKFIPLIVKFAPELRTTWRELVRWFMRQSGGTATLEQLYALAIGHPKLESNPNYKAKIRQQVQQVAERVGQGEWQLI